MYLWECTRNYNVEKRTVAKMDLNAAETPNKTTTTHIVCNHHTSGGGRDSAAELAFHCNAAVHCGKLVC